MGLTYRHSTSEKSAKTREVTRTKMAAPAIIRVSFRPRPSLLPFKEEPLDDCTITLIEKTADKKYGP